MKRDQHDAVALLNEALAREPRAVSNLFRSFQYFEDQELADHPTIQVGIASDDGAPVEHDGKPVYVLSMLGLLNGIFGSDTDRIAMVVDADFYNDDQIVIESFRAYDNWPEES